MGFFILRNSPGEDCCGSPKVKEKEKDADQKRKQGVEAPPAQSVTFKKLV